MTMTIKRPSKLSSWLARQCQARSQTQDSSSKDKLCHRVINSRIHSLSLRRGIKLRGTVVQQPLGGTSFDIYVVRTIQAIDHIDWHICLSFRDKSPTNTQNELCRTIMKSIPFDYLSSSFANEVFIVHSTVQMSTCHLLFRSIDTKKKAREEKEKYNKFCLEPSNIAILSSIAVSWMFACLLRLFVCLFGGLFSHRIFLCSLVELDQKRSSRKIHFG